MRELNDGNELDVAIKKKIREFCGAPHRVDITRTAERDAWLLEITKLGVLEACGCHINGHGLVHADFLDSGEAAYIVAACQTESHILYVKLKFEGKGARERMLIISSHPPRRW